MAATPQFDINRIDIQRTQGDYRTWPDVFRVLVSGDQRRWAVTPKYLGDTVDPGELRALVSLLEIGSRQCPGRLAEWLRDSTTRIDHFYAAGLSPIGAGQQGGSFDALIADLRRDHLVLAEGGAPSPHLGG